MFTDWQPAADSAALISGRSFCRNLCFLLISSFVCCWDPLVAGETDAPPRSQLHAQRRVGSRTRPVWQRQTEPDSLFFFTETVSCRVSTRGHAEDVWSDVGVRAECESLIQFPLKMNQINRNAWQLNYVLLDMHLKWEKGQHDAAVERFFSERKEMESDWTAMSLTRVHLLYFHVAACQGEDRGQNEWVSPERRLRRA